MGVSEILASKLIASIRIFLYTLIPSIFIYSLNVLTHATI
jgi:hypothetical protein